MSQKTRTATAEERRKIVAENLLAGTTYRQMATALDVSLGTIAKDVKILIGRWKREQIDHTGAWVQLDLVRLDRATNAIWDDVIDGKYLAIDRLLRIMERRAKLLGMDEPEERKTKNTTAVVVMEPDDLSDLDDEALNMMLENLLIVGQQTPTGTSVPTQEPDDDNPATEATGTPAT